MFKLVNLNTVDFKQLSTSQINDVIVQMQGLSQDDRLKVICRIFDTYSNYDLQKGKIGYILKQFKEDITIIFRNESY